MRPLRTPPGRSLRLAQRTGDEAQRTDQVTDPMTRARARTVAQEPSILPVAVPARIGTRREFAPSLGQSSDRY